MNKMNKRFVAILIVVLVLSTMLLLSLSYREPEIKSIGINHLRFEGLKPVIGITVEVYNPNMVGGRLKSLDLDVYVNGGYVGAVAATSSVRVPAGGSAYIPVEYSLEALPVFQKTFVVDVSGEAVIGIGFFSFDLDVEETRTIVL